MKNNIRTVCPFLSLQDELSTSLLATSMAREKRQRESKSKPKGAEAGGIRAFREDQELLNVFHFEGVSRTLVMKFCVCVCRDVRGGDDGLGSAPERTGSQRHGTQTAARGGGGHDEGHQGEREYRAGAGVHASGFYFCPVYLSVSS